MAEFHCPNCGHSVAPAFTTVKMLTCESCGSTLFLSGAVTELAGEQGVMHEVPLLFDVGSHIRLGKNTYTIVGHARFSYGRGTWDEFCALDPSGVPVWISVDEGDIVLQEEIKPKKWPRYDGYLNVGLRFDYDGQSFKAVEVSSAECVALRGSFDEPLFVGQTYHYVNCQGDDGGLLSMEREGEQRSWYAGRWFDPFEVEVMA